MKICNDENCYDILFTNTSDEVTQGLKAWFVRNRACQKVLLILDQQLAVLQSTEIENMTTFFRTLDLSVNTLLIESGEESKCLVKAEWIWSQLADLQFSRQDVIIAVGGGVMGDLAGFCASTYMRGIHFIQMPTTLLAQIDSSIGGKVAINLNQGKNLVGSFYNPRLVIIHSQFLKTLPDEVLSDGIGELIKYAYLGHNEILDRLEYFENLEGFRGALYSQNQLIIEMMVLSLRIKKILVERDFKEKNIRRYLNLGHTIGHAIEKGEAYRYSHGHCVANGCLWALKLSGNLKSYNRLIKLMQAYQIPVLGTIRVSDIMTYLRRDKKSEKDGVNFVLPNQLDNISRDTKPFRVEQSDDLLLEGIQDSVSIKWISFEELETKLELLESDK